MIEWFGNQVAAVQTAVIAFLGVLATALVNLANSSVNAWSRARDRGHERKMKQLDRLLDKRLTGAELLIEKMSEFYLLAFDDLDTLKAVADIYAAELRSELYEVLEYDPTGEPFADDDEAFRQEMEDADLNTRGNLRIRRGRKTLRRHHYDVFAALRYDISYWAWSPDAASLKDDLRSLSNWFNSFYKNLVEQADALEAMLRDAPGKEDDEQTRERFAEKLDEFWQALEGAQDEHEEALNQNILMIQAKVIKLLD